MPVGEVDALYQLYWYGIDFAYSDEEGIYMQDSPHGAHEVGTHPTAEDVAKINETYGAAHQVIAEKFEIDIETYRDYYTLAMGLNKIVE